jgi:hypothetical protein
MPHQVDDALPHAMPGTELSRVRTELRLLPPAAYNKSPIASRGADIVMQSSAVVKRVRLAVTRVQITFSRILEPSRAMR